jgi:uncharacterized protein YdeI (YjbR/CyaY-like superfamily)
MLWIDGQLRSLDEVRYLKRFTPRRAGSVWSKRNQAIAENLIEGGRMTEAGQAAIARAKKAGALDAPRSEPISQAHVEMLVKALAGTGTALVDFLRMSPSVKRRYAAHHVSAKKGGNAEKATRADH